MNEYNKKLKIILLLLAAPILPMTLLAQVEFGIEWKERTGTYEVYAQSDVTYTATENIVGTAQISLKSPTGTFRLTELESKIAGVRFGLNGKCPAINSLPNNDYVMVGLHSFGTKGIIFEAGKKIPLFSFKNALGCNGIVSIVDHADPIMSDPIIKKLNIGNEITILGAKGDAYSGIAGEGSTDCRGQLTSTTELSLSAEMVAFPNPASDYVQLKLDGVFAEEVGKTVNIEIYNSVGQKLQKLTKTLRSSNSWRFDLNKITTSGLHTIKVSNGELSQAVKFVIQ